MNLNDWKQVWIDVVNKPLFKLIVFVCKELVATFGTDIFVNLCTEVIKLMLHKMSKNRGHVNDGTEVHKVLCKCGCCKLTEFSITG